MELGFDAMLCSNLGNENSYVGHIKCSDRRQVPATGIKQRVLPLSAVTVSLHHLPKMSEVNSHMQKNALTIVI